MIQSCIVCICWTFSSVCVQMSPQIACLREGIFTLVAFIPFLVTVCYQMFVQNACTRGNKVALAAFVWLFSSVRFQMGSQNACMWGCISQKAAPRLLRGQGNHLQKVVLLHLLHLIPLHHQFDVAHGQALLYVGHHHVLQGKGIDLQNVVLLHLDLTPVWRSTWSGSALCGPPPSPPHEPELQTHSLSLLILSFFVFWKNFSGGWNVSFWGVEISGENL